jgi:CPA2 family monovalent cation:H+ antiporter-2
MPSALELTLLLLAASVLAVAALRVLSLPPVFGYLLVGIALGPHALALVPETADTMQLAEFGVVFLMFSIGLEFSLPRVHSMRAVVFGVGLPQVLITLAAPLALAHVAGGLIGVGTAGGFALGAALAMSSTAIVLKLLAERLELDTDQGRAVVGVLLFQDLAVVPLLVILPALAERQGHLAIQLAWAAVKAVALLALLLAGGQWLLRRWFTLVARRRSRELFMLNLLLVSLGLAWLTSKAGLSLALGSFIAGMLISETEFRHQVEEDIKPFRDVLLGLFFVTIGMLLDPRVVVAHFGWVLAALTVPVGLKFALIAALMRWHGKPAGTAIKVALPLSTAGEFAFVILNQAGQLHLLPAPLMQIVLAAMVLSMLATPLLIQSSQWIALRLTRSEWMQQSLLLTRIATRSIAQQNHVVICGFGRSGQHLARMLEQEGIGNVALDLDPDRVREAAAAGASVVYGDAARRETLAAAGVSRAAALVISYSDVASALRVIHFARELRPRLPIIVRTQDDSDQDRLLGAGATEVVPEVFEGSLMLGSHALVLLGVPPARVLRHVQEARDTRYRLLSGYFHGADDPVDAIDEVHHVRLHSVSLEPGSAAVGHKLGSLDLRTTGADVRAVRRRGIRGDDPSDALVLESGDIVVLRGTAEAIEVAEARLLGQ